MAKKSQVASRKKSTGFAAKIHQMEACIHSDYKNLMEAYPKALADVKKALTQAGQALKKLKASTQSARKTGKGGSKTVGRVQRGSVEITHSERAFTQLKTEQAELLAGYKKLQAKKKIWMKFEKSWAKKMKQAVKPKAMRTRSRRRKTPAATAMQSAAA